MPEIALIKVVFPAPDGPTRATTSPVNTAKLTSSNKVMVPILRFEFPHAQWLKTSMAIGLNPTFCELQVHGPILIRLDSRTGAELINSPSTKTGRPL